MLAKTILSAEELEITSIELDKLLEFRRMLFNKEISYHDSSWQNPKSNAPEGKSFNMIEFGKHTDCGSVGCIGAWMGFLGAWEGHSFQNAFVNDIYSRKLEKLFFPFDLKEAGALNNFCKGLTPEQALVAIDHFLTGVPGQKAWDLAVGND